MALLAYPIADPLATPYSNGNMTNPLATNHHGRNGDTKERKFYIRATDLLNYRFVQVAIRPDPLPVGWDARIMYNRVDPELEPTEDQWNAILPASYLVTPVGDIPDILVDDTVFIPIWVKVIASPGQSVGVKEDAWYEIWAKVN